MLTFNIWQTILLTDKIDNIKILPKKRNNNEKYTILLFLQLNCLKLSIFLYLLVCGFSILSFHTNKAINPKLWVSIIMVCASWLIPPSIYRNRRSRATNSWSRARCLARARTCSRAAASSHPHESGPLTPEKKNSDSPTLRIVRAGAILKHVMKLKTGFERITGFQWECHLRGGLLLPQTRGWSCTAARR